MKNITYQFRLKFKMRTTKLLIVKVINIKQSRLNKKFDERYLEKKKQRNKETKSLEKKKQKYLEFVRCAKMR